MNIKNIITIIRLNLKQKGFKYTIKKAIKFIANKILRKDNTHSYNIWIKNNEPTIEELQQQRKVKFKLEPKFSLIVPMYNTPENYFEELVNCLIKQTYKNWELCLADGSKEENQKICEIVKKDDRIKYKFLNENKGIAGNTNAALQMATGDYIALLDHDDLLPQFCLYELTKTINENQDVEFIYTDEDKISGDSTKRYDPHFKPDFSIDTLRSNNYITHLSVFKKELMEKLKGFREKYDGAQDYDIILRAVENTNKIIHIPKILYHWRLHQNSTAMFSDAKPYAYEAGIRAITDHLERQKIKSKVTHSGDMHGVYEVQYEIQGNPKVSILIPNKDSVKLLKNCINSILDLTTYKNYEIIVIENNSEKEATFKYYKELEKIEKVKVITYPEKGFNYSKIINYGVKNANRRICNATK